MRPHPCEPIERTHPPRVVDRHVLSLLALALVMTTAVLLRASVVRELGSSATQVVAFEHAAGL